MAFASAMNPNCCCAGGDTGGGGIVHPSHCCNPAPNVIHLTATHVVLTAASNCCGMFGGCDAVSGCWDRAGEGKFQDATLNYSTAAPADIAVAVTPGTQAWYGPVMTLYLCGFGPAGQGWYPSGNTFRYMLTCIWNGNVVAPKNHYLLQGVSLPRPGLPSGGVFNIWQWNNIEDDPANTCTPYLQVDGFDTDAGAGGCSLYGSNGGTMTLSG